MLGELPEPIDLGAAPHVEHVGEDVLLDGVCARRRPSSCWLDTSRPRDSLDVMFTGIVREVGRRRGDGGR